MINIFEVWLSTNKYEFDGAPQNYRHDINASATRIATEVARAREFVKEGTCLWSFCTLIEFNPETGEKTVHTWHEAGTPKERIVLNPKGKVVKASAPFNLDDFFAAPPLDAPAVVAVEDLIDDEEDDE